MTTIPFRNKIKFIALCGMAINLFLYSQTVFSVSRLTMEHNILRGSNPSLLDKTLTKSVELD